MIWYGIWYNVYNTISKKTDMRYVPQCDNYDSKALEMSLVISLFSMNFTVKKFEYAIKKQTGEFLSLFIGTTK